MPNSASTQAYSSIAVVNVSSVPQRSPFRYPGGKTWLIPQARAWLRSQPEKPSRFVDVFAGGGSMALLAAAEELAGKAIMVELDPGVAAVWRAVTGGQAEALAVMIEEFDFTPSNVQTVLGGTDGSTLALAFRTILKNRVNRGGILAPGAGVIRAGEANRGLASRWYPATLGRRIRDIAGYRERVEFIEGDSFPVFEALLDDPDAIFCIDPPYTAGGRRAGSRLYLHHQVDHKRLFKLAAKAAGDILLTYDNTEEVKELAVAHGLTYKPVAMRNAHNAPMSELLIGRNLDWAL